MTRATQVTQAISAARRARSTPSSAPESAAISFLIDEDNGGSYHWMIVGDDDEVLVRSDAFDSYEEARQAASIVHHGADRASFGHPDHDTLGGTRS